MQKFSKRPITNNSYFLSCIREDLVLMGTTLSCCELLSYLKCTLIYWLHTADHEKAWHEGVICRKAGLITSLLRSSVQSSCVTVLLVAASCNSNNTSHSTWNNHQGQVSPELYDTGRCKEQWVLKIIHTRARAHTRIGWISVASSLELINKSKL